MKIFSRIAMKARELGLPGEETFLKTLTRMKEFLDRAYRRFTGQ
jgi:hypothetical protein